MPARRQNPSHDAAWKQFFALSVVVEHLLRGFFPKVGALLDFATLRDVAGEWVQDGTRRRGDSVWRVRYRDGTDRSLVVFLEFQSTVDASMARRVLRNVGMAYERMRRNATLDGDRRLRPFCIVIHSGKRRWTAPGSTDRVEVSGSGEVQSSMSEPYATLDARRCAREHLPTRNLVSTLFETQPHPRSGRRGDAAGRTRRVAAGDGSGRAGQRGVCGVAIGRQCRRCFQSRARWNWLND